MAAGGSAIVAENLSRNFGSTEAVLRLNLSVRQGELFGLIGSDGAGKTTTLRLLAGLLTVGGGSAEVAGFDLKSQSESIKPKIGYMAQQFSLYGDLSVWENLDFFADLYNVTGPARRERTDRLLSFAGLGEFRGRRASQLSGGMQKKLALACTLIHQPSILLLDEPTTGVDPVSRREFWEILLELHLLGTTILVSTPYMDEADRCQRVALLHQGKLVVCAKPAEIRRSLDDVLVEFRPENWQSSRGLVSKLPGVIDVHTHGRQLRVFLEARAEDGELFRNVLESEGIKIREFRVVRPSMEEAYLSLLAKSDRVDEPEAS